MDEHLHDATPAPTTPVSLIQSPNAATPRDEPPRTRYGHAVRSMYIYISKVENICACAEMNVHAFWKKGDVPIGTAT